MTILAIFDNWGAAVGSLLGLLGGAFGTWCSIGNTNGPKERAYTVKVAVWTWAFIAVLLGLLFGLGSVLPPPYKSWTPLLVVLIVPVLVIGIPKCNRRQAQIRAEELRGSADGQSEPKLNEEHCAVTKRS